MILLWPEIKHQFNFTLFQTMQHSSNQGKTESQDPPLPPDWKKVLNLDISGLRT